MEEKIEIIHENDSDINRELASLEIETASPVLNDDVLNEYIRNVPALPKTLHDALRALDEDDLQEAAKAVETDPALGFYMRTQVNKSHILRHEIEDIRQVFSSLGVIPARQFLASYLVMLLCGEKWSFFAYSNVQFQELQVLFLESWNKILLHEKLEKDRELTLVGILLPSVFVVCDQIFGARAEEVRLMQQTQHLDCNELLKRIVGLSFFQLAGIIASKWNLPKRTANIVLLAEGANGDLNEDKFPDSKLSCYLHLLIFYLLSRPEQCESNMLGFSLFNADFSEPVRDEFLHVMEIDDEA